MISGEFFVSYISHYIQDAKTLIVGNKVVEIVIAHSILQCNVCLSFGSICTPVQFFAFIFFWVLNSHHLLERKRAYEVLVVPL